MSFEKENFLRTKLVKYLQQLDPATPPRWGKMSVQHMIEHCANDVIQAASGRLKIVDIAVPPTSLGKMREFLMSDKPFRQNTKNPLLSEDLSPLKYKTVQAAIGSLHLELIYFFEAFEASPGLTTRNPFFGDLNFEENVQLLYKHSLHHLRQFGVEPIDI